MDFGANIFIASAGTYFIFKMIPYQINPQLLMWRKAVIFLLILISNFLLMYFAYELPGGVRIDLRYVSVILIAISASPIFTILSALLIGLTRFLFGIPEIAIQALVFILLLALLISIWTHFRKSKILESQLIIELFIVSIIIYATNAIFYYGFQLKTIILIITWALFNGFALLILYGVLFDMRRTRHLYIVETERAFTDALTNLANRRAFDQRIQLLMADHTVKKLSALMLDIDFFKSVNDRYGHIAGDKVLQSCASIIQEHCLENGIPYRLGGEEFCILAINFDEKATYELAEKIRIAIQSTTIPVDSHQKISITISIGVATTCESHAFPEIQHLADRALYQAKNAGRNRCVSL